MNEPGWVPISFIYGHWNLNSHNLHMSGNIILLLIFFQPFKMQKPSWAYCSWIWSTGHSLLTPDPCISEIQFPMKLQSFLITSKFFWLWRGISALSQLAFQTVALQDTIRLLLFSPFSHSGGSSFHPPSTLSTQGCKSVVQEPKLLFNIEGFHCLQDHSAAIFWFRNPQEITVL